LGDGGPPSSHQPPVPRTPHCFASSLQDEHARYINIATQLCPLSCLLIRPLTDVLICSVGSEIFYNTASRVPRALLASQQKTKLPGISDASFAAPPMHPLPGMPKGAQFLPDGSWEAFLDVGWDRAKAQALVQQQFPMLKQQVKRTPWEITGDVS